jgi:hypothetical protein
MTTTNDETAYYHGTKADLKVGALIGCSSNYGERKAAKWAYFSDKLARLKEQGAEIIED